MVDVLPSMKVHFSTTRLVDCAIYSETTAGKSEQLPNMMQPSITGGSSGRYFLDYSCDREICVSETSVDKTSIHWSMTLHLFKTKVYPKRSMYKKYGMH